MKKFLHKAVFAGLVLGMLFICGCSREKLSLIKDRFVINIGSEVKNKVTDYARGLSRVTDAATLDISKVDTQKAGEYPANIVYENNTYNFTIVVKDLTAPMFTLYDDVFYIEEKGKIKKDDVFKSVDDTSKVIYGFSDDMRLADSDKKILDEVSFDTIGEYTIEPIAKDEFDNIKVGNICVRVVKEGTVPGKGSKIEDFSAYMNPKSDFAPADISTISETPMTFGIGNNVEIATNRPDLAAYNQLYLKYDVDFIMPDSKFVWLTFNEAYEKGYTTWVLDILKEKEVPAVFFITKSYAEQNPELVKRMIDEGHILGNYLTNSQDASTLTQSGLTGELDVLNAYVKETFGYDMYLFRPPSGYFSEKVLAIAQNLGYRTVFWSFAYADWNNPDVALSLANAVNKLHGGEIMALSGASQTNLEMLSELIDTTRSKGFNFAKYQK